MSCQRFDGLGRRVASLRGMGIHDRSTEPTSRKTAFRTKRVLAALSLITAGTLSVSAQHQAAVGRSARATTRRTVTNAAVSKVRTNTFTTIQGNALNSINGPLNDVVVRLRDARFGRIVDTQLTDQSGLFAFKAIDPGSYIVEVMANDESVLAASQLLNVNAGEAVSAVVKLPFRMPPFAGVLGSTPSATAVSAGAAASSIAAMVKTIPISPAQ